MNPMQRLRQYVAGLRSIIDSTLPDRTKVSMLLAYVEDANLWVPWVDTSMLLIIPDDEGAEAVTIFARQLRMAVGDTIYDAALDVNVRLMSRPGQRVLDLLAALPDDYLERNYNLSRKDATNFDLDEAVFEWRDANPRRLHE
jgi:hypothetical protein